MQSFHSLSDKSENENQYDVITKIDRLLRLYRISKKTDEKIKNDIEIQIKRLKDEMKQLNSEGYEKI